METLFRPGIEFPTDNQGIIQNDARTPSPVNSYSSYILVAVVSVKQHIDNKPFEFKSAAELLDHLNTPNRNSVEKAFKDVYGARIKEYMVRQRLGCAKDLLQKGISKKSIAYKCLYESPSAFCTAFRKEFGITPTQWERTTQAAITATSIAKR